MCKRYDRCLDFAARSHWQGFHCDRCSTREEITFAEAVREMRARTQGEPLEWPKL
jgi:hypothetical protein